MTPLPADAFRLLLVPALLAAAACQPQDGPENGSSPSSQDPVASQVAAETPATNTVDNSAQPAAAPVQIASTTEMLEFSYGWPAEATRIAPLDAWFRGNGEAIQRKWQADAKQALADSKKDGWVWRTYSYEERYGAQADTPRMLVLVSDGYQYTGGAHGMPIATAVIWDKQRSKRLATGQVIDLAALKRVAEDRFCEALDMERAERRGEPVPADRPDMFDECIDITRQLVVPVSTRGGALDTIRVMIGPYEAGPYAEGSYQIDLPVTGDLLAVVRPAYRTAFAIR